MYWYLRFECNKLLTTSMRERGTDKYMNAHIKTVAIQFSRKREQEPFASRTLVRLIVLD